MYVCALNPNYISKKKKKKKTFQCYQLSSFGVENLIDALCQVNRLFSHRSHNGQDVRGRHEAFLPYTLLGLSVAVTALFVSSYILSCCVPGCDESDPAYKTWETSHLHLKPLTLVLVDFKYGLCCLWLD